MLNTLDYKLTGKISRTVKSRYKVIRKELNFRLSRHQAINTIKLIRKINKRTIVDDSLKTRIKSHCKTKFGSEKFWPWLVVYTEIRGEFNENWIPDDYYKFILLDKLNHNSMSQISGLKSYDHKLFPEYTITPLLIKIGNVLYDDAFKRMLPQDAVEKLKKFSGEVIIKRVTAGGGKGITFLKNNEVNEEALYQNFDYVLQPVIHQEQGLAKLNKDSLNTFRIYTYIDEDGECTVRKIFLKYGREGSRIDNISAGGGFIHVNEQGYLDKYSYTGLGIKSEFNKQIYPDNKLPYYADLQQSCINAHKQFPFVRFIGWDIAVNENSQPIIIEWNTGYPLFWVYEATAGPFWDKVPYKDKN